MNKILTLLAILGFLVLAMSSIAMAQPKSVSKKAEYRVTGHDTSYLVTIWFNKDVIAYSSKGSNNIALWRMWGTDYPSFFQVYSDVNYRIEFDRVKSQSMQIVLNNLEKLVDKGDFIEEQVIEGRQFSLTSLESGESVEKTMNQWRQYKTFDYADIGDNEADPVLGKLIQQGFIQGL